MAHLSGVPVRPNSLRPPLAGLPASTRSRFSLGAPRQRRVTEATAAGAQHRRSCQTARAAPKEAAQPQRQPRGDAEDDRMGRKGRKGKSAAASMNEATLVRVNKALEDFRASDAEGSHPFASSSFGGCFCDWEAFERAFGCGDASLGGPRAWGLRFGGDLSSGLAHLCANQFLLVCFFRFFSSIWVLCCFFSSIGIGRF